MKIAVGSQSRAKLKAVELALEAYDVMAEVMGIDVPSGVAAQPLTVAETAQGALNRARAALVAMPDATLGVGLEGGIMQPLLGDPQLQPYTMGFVAITDGNRTVLLPTAGLAMPPKLSQALQDGKAELRPLALALGMPYDHEAGVFSLLTGGVVRRVDNDSAAVRNALASWLCADAYAAADAAH